MDAEKHQSQVDEQLQLAVPKYVLLCVNQGTHLKLRKIEVTTVWHDEILFRKLRDAYEEVHRGQRRSWLTAPKTMRYIKVRDSNPLNLPTRILTHRIWTAY